MASTRQPEVKATFHCAVCGQTAGTVEALFRGAPRLAELAWLRDSEALVITFYGVTTQGITPQQYQALHRVLANHDAQALYDSEELWAPFYCPGCHASYCIKHWDVDVVFEEDAWYDCSYGTCPQGHKRIIDD